MSMKVIGEALFKILCEADVKFSVFETIKDIHAIAKLLHEVFLETMIAVKQSEACFTAMK